MPPNKHDSYPLMEFKDGPAFEKWLAKNNSIAEGAWLKMAKGKAGIKTIVYPEAVEIALCYGWIDGLARRIDDDFYMQKFTPRRPNSIWSVINKKKVAALIKAGRMQSSGLAAINEAKKNGRWKNAYESPTKIKVPVDFQEAVNKSPAAKSFFEKLTGSNRYALLFRLANVKTEATRKRKIAEYVKMLEEGRTVYKRET